MYRKLLCFCLLVMAMWLASPCQASPTQSDGEGAFLPDIFTGEKLPAEVNQDVQKMAPVGPGLLLFGIILLAASGQQYAKQLSFTRLEMTQIQNDLEALVDGSIYIDAAQHESLHTQLEAVVQKKEAVAAELLRLIGGETS